MKKIRIIVLAIVLAVALQATYASVSPIREDFAKFDRSYISALFLTMKGNKEKAELKLLKLSKIWSRFKSDYYSYSPKDSLWKKDFDKVGEILNSAKELVSKNEIQKAHETLEKIRGIFYNLRKRNGIDYYLDGIIKFHANMEKIVHPLKDKKPKDVNAELISELKTVVTKAKEDWNDFANRKFDATVFSFTPEKTQKLKAAIQAESNTLKKLENALAQGNKAKIIKAGLAVKKNFRKVFLLFSDLK